MLPMSVLYCVLPGVAFNRLSTLLLRLLRSLEMAAAHPVVVPVLAAQPLVLAPQPLVEVWGLELFL
jgi:hypothetical protein